MEYRRFGDTILLRLDKGDELSECIKYVAQTEEIRLASISGIGGTDNFTIGVYNPEKLGYDSASFSETHEITALAGNISAMDGRVYTHIHMTCAGKGGIVVGGHLLRCVISLTAEIFLRIIDGNVGRKLDAELQINKLDFGI